MTAGSIAWIALAGGGLFALTAHGAVAGRAADAPLELSASPLGSSLRRDGRATLVMVAHPGCPCTRASLRELERVLAALPLEARRASGPDVIILFAGARGGRAAGDRVARDLRALADAIPGARVVDDAGGREAARLGAHTSGTVLFYDQGGRLRFAGGITPSRGHDGDSAGADALRGLLSLESSRAATPTATGAAVYGCALSDEATP